jgi:hypothetical protein
MPGLEVSSILALLPAEAVDRAAADAVVPRRCAVSPEALCAPKLPPRTDLLGAAFDAASACSDNVLWSR